MIRLFFLSRRTWAAFFWAVFVLWVGVLWFLSSHEGSENQQSIPYLDKVLHFGYFFVGTTIVLLAVWNSTRLRGWKSMLLAVAITALVGISDEWHQMFVPFREGGDPFDWLADCAGGIAAVLVLGWIYGEAKRRKFCGQGK